ncbi:MAG: GNAT family N-acetyltransferase [Blastocatellia bacterium]
MITSKTTSPLNVEIIPSLPEQESVLANMLELYAHDFSAFMDMELGADGRFGYERLPLYWKEAGRYPFFIKANGQLAGFVLLNKGSQISGDEDIWDMTEFFVVRGYRRLGVGMKAAREVWKQFPGRWEVRVIDRNQKAKEFWARAIAEFLGKTIHPTPFKKNGEGWHIFSFESTRAA